MDEPVKERPVYPTLGNEKDVIELGKTMFPKSYWNQMVSLLNTYRNTVIKNKSNEPTKESK